MCVFLCCSDAGAWPDEQCVPVRGLGTGLTPPRGLRGSGCNSLYPAAAPWLHTEPKTQPAQRRTPDFQARTEGLNLFRPGQRGWAALYSSSKTCADMDGGAEWGRPCQKPIGLLRQLRSDGVRLKHVSFLFEPASVFLSNLSIKVKRDIWKHEASRALYLSEIGDGIKTNCVVSLYLPRFGPHPITAGSCYRTSSPICSPSIGK